MMDGTLPPPKLFVGVDIAAATATVAWMTPGAKPSRSFTIAQTPQGFAALRERLGVTGYAPHQMLIVMEATGTYWMRLATMLAEADYGVSVVNPRQAHNFAKTLLKRAKTDAIDAQLLARLGALLQPAPWTPPPAIYTELHQRLAHRDALVAMRQQTRQQLHALLQQPVVVAAVRERLEGVITFFTAQLADLDAEIAATIPQDAVWAAAAARLQTIVGIGLLTSAWLLVATLNFTTCPRPESLVAYAGLAPHPQQSGTSIQGHTGVGQYGHAQLRTVLYLATLSAARYNPAIKPFYDRLRERGKASKVARCAAARKLLHIAWAVATKGQPFDPHEHERQVAQRALVPNA